jgi:hypothetical protein
MAPPQPPSLELPKPPSDLRASRKGNRVILTWTIPTSTTDRQTIRKPGLTEICRGIDRELTECGSRVGKVTPPQNASKASKQNNSASYTDNLSPELETGDPTGFASYAVEALNYEGRSAGISNRVRVSLVRTLPPPQNFQAKVAGQGVVLTWGADVAPGSGDVRYVYRIFRGKRGQQGAPSAIGEVPADHEQAFSFTDSQIEWQNSYEYHAEAVTLISPANRSEIQVEGDDTPTVTVFADDVFPPAVPAGLQAVYSGPGQQPFVDLVWAPVSDVDLAGYNVYRHTEGDGPTRISTEPVKTPAYRDANVEPGKRYFYSVSSVDLRGNESARSEEANEAVPH